jgi:hypothetical protein
MKGWVMAEEKAFADKNDFVNWLNKAKIDATTKFLPIVLLRELYYVFVPEELKNNDVIRIVVNQIVESNLYGLPELRKRRIMFSKILHKFYGLLNLIR